MTVHFEPNRDLLYAFATPVAMLRVAEGPAINPGLKRIIAEREVTSPTLGKSNIGGWHSEGDLLEWPVPETKVLLEAIKTGVTEVIALTSRQKAFDANFGIAAWANVTRKGGYNRSHHHPRCHWSGVYYVDIGDESPNWPDSGKLEFHDPRGAIDMMRDPFQSFGKPVVVTPQDGKMVVFPSWLQHEVHPYQGTRDRISIAFNVTVTKKEGEPTER